ncbi:hypothetical protein AGOR_G00038370 [Albula goreensis]|uniref:Keratinocyte-associated protein 3 n=1 Tax=Albula goreensis TaxID=1534307 RepID=A0A8T3E1D9_9TELE|nr:hypothetical protein AGOR_G00038370 [Albula goreensis]
MKCSKKTCTYYDLTWVLYRMVDLGLCNASLKDDRTLMKMGLSMVLVGHVNFLLGALVHGAVLRHISLHKQARTMEYAISNVIALVSGMVGAIVGISAIVLSKNKKNKLLMWLLLVASMVCSLLAAASVMGLTVSVSKAVANGGKSLLTHCKFPNAAGYSSITNECPFDPTRIYGTTIFLWIPMVFLSVVELAFSGRCVAACVSFLHLPCAIRRKRRGINIKRVKVWRPEEMVSPPQTESRYHEPYFQYQEPELQYQEVELQHQEVELNQQEVEQQHQEVEQQHQEVELQHQEVEIRHQEAELQYQEVILEFQQMKLQLPKVGLHYQVAEPRQQKQDRPEHHELVSHVPRARVSRARQFNRASLWI